METAGRAMLANLARILAGNPELNAAALGRLLDLTGFFDEKFYLAQNTDVAAAGLNAAWHYAAFGYMEGRNPAAWLNGRAPAARQGESCRQYLLRLAALFGPAPQPQMLVWRQGSYETAYDMPLFVNWGVTDMCNYDCSYCFGHQKPDKRRFAAFGQAVNAIDNLASLNRPAYDFVLGGGEPTIYPHFIELLYLMASRFKGRLYKIQIISNGSRDDDFYRQLKDIAALAPLSLELSIHTEYVKPERLFDLVELLHDSMELVFPLMLNPAKYEFAKDIFAELCRLRTRCRFAVNIATLRQPPDFAEPDARYTKEMRDWQAENQARWHAIADASDIGSSAAKPVYPRMFCDVWQDGRLRHINGGHRHVQFQQGLFAFQGMYCACGTHMVRIAPGGNMNGFVCNARPYAGNIFKPGALAADGSHFQMVKCPLPNCGCRANDPLMKFRDKTEADNYLRLARAKQARLAKEE